MSPMVDQYPLDQILPQKYPFLMIDRIVEFKKDESLTAIKNITGNEWVFEGLKYPNNIFPETLIIEAAAQTALAFYKLNKNDPIVKKKQYAVIGKIKSEFFESVKVGDQLKMQTGSYKMFENTGFVDIDIHVATNKIAEVKNFYSVLNTNG